MRVFNLGVRLVVVSAVLAGCSMSTQRTAPSKETGSSQIFLAQSAEASEHAGTVKLEGTLEQRSTGSSEADSGLGDIRIKHTGTWDFEKMQGELVYDSKDFEPPPKEAGISRLLFEKDAFYKPVPPDRVRAAGGKHWLRMERGKFGQQNPLGIGGVTSPANVLEALQKVAKGVKKVGEEPVRGERCAKYSMKVSLLSLLQGMDGEEPVETEESLETEESAAWTKAIVPVEVWIGKKDRLLRRVVIDMSMKDSGFFSTTTLDLFDYGTPAQIQMPPASDTYTPKDLDDYNRVMGYDG